MGTFARMALDKELDRISGFSKQNKVINKTASDHELLDTDQEFSGTNSIAKKSITSDSTEITGSLTGRKRFFERVTAECNTNSSSNKNIHKSHISTTSLSSSSSNTNINTNVNNNKTNNNYNIHVYQNHDIPKSSSNTPVILNPYYHQHTSTSTSTTPTNNNNTILNQIQPTSAVSRRKIPIDHNKKHKK